MEKLLKSMKHWQVPVVGLLGLWFAVSPWVLGTAHETRLMAVSLVVGLALVASAVAMTRGGHASSGAWSGLVLGLVAAVSTWLLGHSEDMNQVLNAVATGLLAAILSCMVGLAVMDPDKWWNDRVAQ